MCALKGISVKEIPTDFKVEGRESYEKGLHGCLYEFGSSENTSGYYRKR